MGHRNFLELVQGVEQRVVVRHRFPKPKAHVGNDVRHTRLVGRVDPALQMGHHLVHHVVVGGVVLHGGGCSLHVHQHVGARACATTFHMSGSASPPDTSLMMSAPSANARRATSAWKVSTLTMASG